jgi:hypothetical protein
MALLVLRPSMIFGFEWFESSSEHSFCLRRRLMSPPTFRINPNF